MIIPAGLYDIKIRPMLNTAPGPSFQSIENFAVHCSVSVLIELCLYSIQSLPERLPYKS